MFRLKFDSIVMCLEISHVKPPVFHSYLHVSQNIFLEGNSCYLEAYLTFKKTSTMQGW